MLRLFTYNFSPRILCLDTTDRQPSSRPKAVITLIVYNAFACLSRTGVLKSAQLGAGVIIVLHIVVVFHFT
jgi:hypothetical protein